MRRVARVVIGLFGPLLAMFVFVDPFSPSVAGAENPTDVQAELADDGIYVAPGRTNDVDTGAVLATIERARAEGVSMQVLWPDEPQPNAGAFARRVQELNNADVVLVFGPEGELGSHVAEDYEDGSIRAFNAARDATGAPAKADAYLTGLLEEPVRERPEIISTLVRWIAILIALLVAGAVGEQMIRKYKRSRKQRMFEEASQ